MPRIFIATPVHNRIDRTIEYVRSVELSRNTGVTLVICDDGSTDGTAEYLGQHHPGVVVLQGDGNLWWSGGTNLCIEYILKVASSEDLVLTLNDDVIIDSEYLRILLETHNTYPNSLIGSMSVFRSDPEKIEAGLPVRNWFTAKKGYENQFGERIGARHHGVVSAPKLCGKGTLIPVSVFIAIGLYDAETFPQYAADEDFSLRARKAGFDLLLNYDARVLSEVAATGLGTERTVPRIDEFLMSLFTRRSPNCLAIRFRFAVRHCPWWLLPSHLIFDLFRVFGGFSKRYLQYQLKSFRK